MVRRPFLGVMVRRPFLGVMVRRPFLGVMVRRPFLGVIGQTSHAGRSERAWPGGLLRCDEWSSLRPGAARALSLPAVAESRHCALPSNCPRCSFVIASLQPRSQRGCNDVVSRQYRRSASGSAAVSSGSGPSSSLPSWTALTRLRLVYST